MSNVIKMDIQHTKKDIQLNRIDSQRVAEIQTRITALQNKQHNLVNAIDEYNSISIQIRALITELEMIKSKY